MFKEDHVLRKLKTIFSNPNALREAKKDWLCSDNTEDE